MTHPQAMALAGEISSLAHSLTWKGQPLHPPTRDRLDDLAYWLARPGRDDWAVTPYALPDAGD